MRRSDAPKDLVSWAEDKPVDQAWDECLRADWLLWIAAVEKVPLVALVDGARACVRRAVEARAPQERDQLEPALEAAEQLRSNEACRRAAKACRAHAAREEKTYRDRPNPPFAWAARAAADLAEAADALLSAEAKRGADRDLAQVGRGAAVGVGEHVITSGEDVSGPLHFDLDDDLTYGCVAALEDALQACTRALIEPGAPPEASDRAAETVANDLFEVLDPVRDGMKTGKAPDQLVRRVEAKLYADDQSEAIAEKRRPMMGTAAALIIPVGGGHYHAGESYTGAVLTFGVALQLLMPLPAAWVLIVIGDAWLSRDAVRRRNAEQARSPARQAVLGLVIVAVSYGLAHLLGALSSGALASGALAAGGLASGVRAFVVGAG